jgi:hypothetical protein
MSMISPGGFLIWMFQLWLILMAIGLPFMLLAGLITSLGASGGGGSWDARRPEAIKEAVRNQKPQRIVFWWMGGDQGP